MQRNILCIHVMDTSGLEGLSILERVIFNYRDYCFRVASGILAQNNRQPYGLYPVPIEHLGAQIESVTQDYPIHALHIGILTDIKQAQLVQGLVHDLSEVLVVLDPIMKTTLGFPIHPPEQLREMVSLFSGRMTVLLPNTEELAVLANVDAVRDLNEVKALLPEVYQTYRPKYLVVKGGRLEETPRVFDLIYDGSRTIVIDHGWNRQRRILGKGDAFAAVLITLLARNTDIQKAVDRAMRYVTRAMSHAFSMGDESSPQPLNLNIPVI